MKKLIVLLCAICFVGCASTDPYTGEKKTSNTGKGAGIGAIVGAVAGAAVAVAGAAVSSSLSKAALVLAVFSLLRNAMIIILVKCRETLPVGVVLL